MKLNIVANILGSSGYVSHSRQVIKELYKLNPEISLDCQKFQGWEQLVNDDELKMMKQEPYIDAPMIAITLPTQWPDLLSDAPNGFYPYLVWEGSAIPLFWLEYLADNRVTKVLCPSQHTINAVINTITANRCHILKDNNTSEEIYHMNDKYAIIINKLVLCPHGVNLELFKPIDRKANDKFTFLTNKGWASGINDRGGVQWAIQAFNQEFNKDEQVQLTIKINPAYCGQGWNLNDEINKLGLRENGGTINVTTDNVPFDKIPEFYSMGDVFLAPNMSESFGLPIAEAMACGLPAITTNYGGQTDFVTKDNGWLIDYYLVDVDWDYTYEGMQWGKPNIEHLQKLMRHVYNNLNEVKQKGIKANQDIQKYSWENTARIILDNITKG